MTKLGIMDRIGEMAAQKYFITNLEINESKSIYAENSYPKLYPN